MNGVVPPWTEGFVAATAKNRRQAEAIALGRMERSTSYTFTSISTLRRSTGVQQLYSRMHPIRVHVGGFLATSDHSHTCFCFHRAPVFGSRTRDLRGAG